MLTDVDGQVIVHQPNPYRDNKLHRAFPEAERTACHRSTARMRPLTEQELHDPECAPSADDWCKDCWPKLHSSEEPTP